MRTITTLVAVPAVLALLTAPAAAGPMDVIRDCSEDGVLNGKYSQSELGGALERLPSDLDEYTDCRAVIRRAQLGAAGGGPRGAKRSAAADRVDSAAPATARERRQIAKARGSDDPVRIGTEGVRPGDSAEPFKSAGFGTELPALVLVVLIALGASTLAGAGLAARHRFGDTAAAAGAAGFVRRVSEVVKHGVSRLRG